MQKAISLRTITIYVGILLILTGCVSSTYSNLKATVKWCFACLEIDVSEEIEIKSSKPRLKK